MRISDVKLESLRSLESLITARAAKQTETELKTGLELLGRDKKMIRDLIELVDPPKQH
jgi:hypothetical protein